MSSEVAVLNSAEQRPPEPVPPGPRLRGARAMPRATRLLFAAVGVTAVLEVAAMTAGYLGYSRYYVTTDNATVDGQKITINAPETGSVTGWSIDDGSTIHTRQILGRIRPVGGGARPVRPVLAPGNGTVAVNNVVNGTYVTQGAELATAYNLNRTYITARVNADEIDGVHPGAAVTFTADSVPGDTMTGLVRDIQSATASEFSIYPTAGSANPANPTIENQYIPVRILLLDTGGHTLLPGTNVTVRITKTES